MKKKKRNPENIEIMCLNCETVPMELVSCGQDLKVDRCSECGGIWLDGREFIDLKELGVFYIKNLDTSGKEPVEKNRIRECPRCEVVLQPARTDDGSIKVDRCPDCKGMWLDRGELLQLAGL
jgi:Zn-finger nucleic acid-binding protein